MRDLLTCVERREREREKERVEGKASLEERGGSTLLKQTGTIEIKLHLGWIRKAQMDCFHRMGLDQEWLEHQ